VFSNSSRRSSGKCLASLLLSSLALLLLGAFGAATATASEAPVAAYSFDENSGAVAHDSIGTHDGNFKNGTTWSSSGKFGSAVHFDGVDDLITVPNSSDLNPNKNFTFEAWVKPEDSTLWNAYLSKQGAWEMIGEGDHTAPKAEVAREAGWNYTINATSQLPLNAWNHLALTADGEHLRLYLNGTQVSSVPITTIYTTTGALQIGGEPKWSDYFKGYVDEVRIYDRTLSGTEIGKDKETAVGWTKPNPVAAYSLDENSGLVAHDAVGTHDGAVENGAEWATGKFGSAVHFDGIDDVVTVPNSSDLNPTKDFTFEAWVKPDDSTLWNAYLSKQGAWEMIGEGDHTAPKAEVAREPGWNYTINATSQLPLNAWNHLALTNDGEHLRLYLNGTQVSNVPSTTIYTTSGALRIGGEPEWSDYFKGYVDEVRIYNRTLSGAEIGKDKEASLGAEWPETVIDSGPEGSTKQTSNTFTYHSTLTGSTFLCAVDAGAYASCPSTGYTTSALAAGAHTFSVKAKSSAGVADPSAATRSFTVDTAAPDTSIEFGPEGLVSTSQPELGYLSTEEESSFECRFDSAAYVACNEDEFFPATPLANGAHAYSVRAVDPAGNVDSTPATGSFSVDATPPSAQATGGPSGPTASSAPTFNFSAGGGTVTCVVEPESAEVEETPFVPCTTASSYTVGSALADGSYTFVVKALDSAENERVDLREFTVDTVAPQTTIASGPSATTDDSKPAFSFSAGESASYSCRFDGAAFAPCTGPGATQVPATALADGSHSFEVRAQDSAGNVDATPAKQTFTVKTTGPQTTITSAPGKAISTTVAKFVYSANKTATFECRLDSAAFAACGSSKEYTALAQGKHSFEVRALASAIADPTPARQDFIVDTSAPTAPVVSGALKNPSETGMTLDVEAKDGDPSTAASTRSGVAAIRVKIDGTVVSTVEAPCEGSACAATADRTIQLPYQQAVGTHQIAVESRDGVGNYSAAVSWEETASSSQELLARKGNPNCNGRQRISQTRKVIRGTPCPDLIIARGGGDHTIEAFTGDDIILGDSGEDTVKAGPGDDFVRTRRSNDHVYGEAGNDKVYSGIGDDDLFGGDDSDLLDGGPGRDEIEGEAGGDTLRGGQGNNKLTGGAGTGTDTFSFSDAVTPGFTGSPSGFGNFPGGESGVKVDLNSGSADNGPISQGGQQDTFVDHPERVIGSAFNDWLIGTEGNERLDGGPGADYVDGGGGTGDSFDNDNTDYRVGGKTPKFNGRNGGSIEVGSWDTGLDRSFYMAGSNKADLVNVRRQGSSIQFIARNATVAGRFSPKSGCKRSPSEKLTVNCAVNGVVGAIVVYGDSSGDTLEYLGGNLELPGALEMLGGHGSDDLGGSTIEDLLVDGEDQGSGLEHLIAKAGDDAVLQGSKADVMVGGVDDDLLISGTICRPNEAIYGDDEDGVQRGGDNAQFHFIDKTGVKADLQTEKLSRQDGKCYRPKGATQEVKETLSAVDMLEGSPKDDTLRGDNKNNNLLGRGGADTLLAFQGIDQINALDEAVDNRIDCGPGKDTAHIDLKLNEKAKRCEDRDEDGPVYTDKNIAAASAEPEPVLQDLFRLDETSQTTAANAAGGSDGTYEAVGIGPSVNGPGPVLGATTSLLTTEAGTSVAFDGVDDFVDLGDQGLPVGGGAGAYSVSLLAKFDKAPGGKEFLFSSGDSGGGAFLYRDTTGKVVFSSGLTPGAPEVRSAVAVNDESWHQLTGTLEGETITLFVDGFPYELGYGESVMPKLDSEDQGQIAAGPTTKELFDGTLDQVATYESALTEGQVITEIAESKAEQPETLLAPAAEGDGDGDGVADDSDNCATVANASQVDADLNGVGDACDTFDSDGDEIADGSDNCPTVYNPGQADANANGIGDDCAALPPTVLTEPASSVGSSGATLNAKVDPEGLATTYRFEYGTTTAYGTSVPFTAKSAGSGATAVAGNQAVTGLAAGTTYHYRVVAASEIGQSFGEDLTFTTGP
jgi:Ca2+-binding RTX toxin-like protein